jgi:hypothetical protein
VLLAKLYPLGRFKARDVAETLPELVNVTVVELAVWPTCTFPKEARVAGLKLRFACCPVADSEAL